MRQCRRTVLLQRLTSYRVSVLGLEPLRNHPFEPTLHSNAWAAISARETPVLLGIFGGRLQHSMRPPLWLAPSHYLWTNKDWPCRLGCRPLSLIATCRGGSCRGPRGPFAGGDKAISKRRLAAS